MPDPAFAVYGHIPPDLAEVPQGSIQCSPLAPSPASRALPEFAAGTLSGIVVLAPPGTIERRRVLALALRALAPGGRLTALAPKDKGGTRLEGELSAMGCATEESHKHHHRIVTAVRPEAPIGLDAAISEGAPRRLPDLGLWSQPGIFSWDRIDPGTRLLLENLPALEGRGADLGCGIAILARAVIERGRCSHLTLIDIDRRALDMARRNLEGARITTLWADVRTARDLPTGLDFVVMNPPFHDSGIEDRALGHAFIAKAAAMLRPGGVLWMTANRHLPYEATLGELFETIDQVAAAGGYKILSARKGAKPPRRAAPPARADDREPIPGYEDVPGFELTGSGRRDTRRPRRSAARPARHGPPPKRR